MEMNDLIDRELLKSELIKKRNISDDHDFANKDVWEVVEDLPSAEPKRGKWIAYKGVQIPERHGLHYCSNCYHSLHLASNGKVYNYCPCCGAKMEVEK